MYQHGSKPTFKLKQHIYILTNRNITHLLKCICFTNIWNESILKNLLIIRVNMNHLWRLMLGLDIKISSHANSTISKMVFSFPNSIYLSWWCWWEINNSVFIVMHLTWPLNNFTFNWVNGLQQPWLHSQINFFQVRCEWGTEKFNQYLNGINPPMFVYLIVVILCIFDVNSGEKDSIMSIVLFIFRH